MTSDAAMGASELRTESKVTKGFVRIHQFLIFGMNMFLFIYGFGLVALGSWLLVDSRTSHLLSLEYRRATGGEQSVNVDSFFFGSRLFIAVGVISVVAGIIGCCGAVALKRWVLLCFVGLLVALFFMELGFGVWCMMDQPTIQNKLGAAFLNMVAKYYMSPEIFRETIDIIQIKFECCGDAGCDDYIRAFGTRQPASCATCDGCRRIVWIGLRKAFTALAIAGAVALVMMVAAMIAAMILVCNASRYRNVLQRSTVAYDQKVAYQVHENEVDFSDTSSAMDAKLKSKIEANERYDVQRFSAL